MSLYDVTNDLRPKKDKDPLSSEAAWWLQDKATMWQDVIAVGQMIETAGESRRGTRLRHARMYSNREFRGFGVGEHAKLASTATKDSRLTLNVIKACVDTAACKVAKNKPRPLFLTSDGDYEQQERAEGLTKYCDGLFDSSRVYQAGQRVFVDACIFDTGCMRVFEEGGEIKAERVLIDEILMDEDDGRDMRPRQIHHVRYVERAVLAGMFPEHADVIRSAARQTGNGGTSNSASNLIKVYDAYHIRSGKNVGDGMRCICIEDATLFAEEWDKDYIPYVFFRWTLPLTGPFGQSLVDELAGIQVEINRLLRMISRAIDMAVPRVFVDNASMVNPGSINNELWQVIRYNGRPPVFSPTSAMSPEVYQQLWALYAKAFEISGVSQMAATAKKEPGVDAAVAMRELADQASERFILQGQRLEDFYMEAAEIMVDMTRDLALRAKEKGEKGPSVKTKTGKFVETIDWRKVDLDEDKYVMRVFPTSLLPTQPAGRLQTVKELMADGFLTDREQALELIDVPDLQKVVSLKTAGLDTMRWVISEILSHGRNHPPTKYMSLKQGLVMAQAELLNAERQGRPQDRIDLLQMWMDQAEALLDEEDAKAAGPMMPPGPPGMPPGAPGMPPGMPPPDLGLPALNGAPVVPPMPPPNMPPVVA